MTLSLSRCSGVVESRFTSEHVAASLQVAWPRFKVAAEAALQPADCTDEDRWHVAIFDALAGNTDRNATNWGFIEDLKRAKLIDHGNGFGAAPTTSQFATELNGQAIPERCLEYVETFAANRRGSRLKKVLPGSVGFRAVRGGAMVCPKRHFVHVNPISS